MAFDWGYFFSLFSIGAFWQACVTVIVISTLSWGIGLVVGFLLACAKLSAPRWVKIPVELYIWFFRSVPLMVLLVFVYNLPQLFPVTQPLLGVPFIAGLVSMTVTEAAYMAEIHRGGLLSVAKGAERGRPCAELQLYRHPAADRDPSGVSHLATDADQ